MTVVKEVLDVDLCPWRFSIYCKALSWQFSYIYFGVLNIEMNPNGVVGRLFVTFNPGLNELGLRRLVELLDLRVGGERL